MREGWTDERLDDLNDRVSDGFAQVDRRFERIDRRFEQVDRRFERVEGEIKDLRREMNSRFDSLQRVMIQGVIGFCSFVGTGFAALIALIVTQL